MDPMAVVNLLGTLIPIVGSTVSEIATVVAAMKAAAAAHGFDLDTQALTNDHAEAVRRRALADAEVTASEPPTA